MARRTAVVGILGLIGLGLGCGDGGTGTNSGAESGGATGSSDDASSTAGPITGAASSDTSGDSSASGASGGTDTGGSDTGEETYELVVDYATYLGGTAWERIQSVYVAPGGDIYVCGTTKSNDFPVTAGAYDTNGNGGTDNDAFVARFSPPGDLVWATYLRGSQRDDCYGVRADDTGVYVTGWTMSDDFPTTPGAHSRMRAGDFDIFVSKLSLDGASLPWSTLLGGANVDQCRGALAIDAAANRIVLSGYTESGDFPGTGGGHQPGYAGGQGDVIVAALADDGSTLLAATYLGGGGPDHGFSGLVQHDDGSVSVAGSAGAADFPTSAGVAQEVFGGASPGPRWPGDAFVARLSADLSGLVFSTFLGGADNDHAAGQNALALGPNGELAVAGVTNSDDFPVTAGAFAPDLAGTQDLFVTVLSEDGTALLGSTYVGGSAEPATARYEPSGVAVDAAGRVFFTGWTGVSDYPTTPNAAQPTYASGGSDVVLTVLAPDLSALEYSTFFGGTQGAAGSERARALWLDAASGGPVFVGDTDATDFPVTAGAYQPVAAGGGDAHLVRFVAP